MSATETIEQVDEFKKLNNLVLKKTEKYYENVSKTNSEEKPLPEFEAIRTHAFGNVYHKRYVALVAIYCCLGVFLLSQTPDVKTFVVSLLAMYLWYDFYSGILHVCLDHPDNIEMPLIGQGCLEFQWHHHIPQDITSKPFVQVCGDLNMVVGLSMAWYCLVLGYTTGAGAVLAGFKMYMAYFGQYCHRMSHQVPKKRPTWVKYMQKWGLMLSPEEHSVHHLTFNDNFCIGAGVCSPVIAWLLENVTKNRIVWLISFFICSFIDVPLILNLLQSTVLA